jgi:hypothetical protein
MEPPHPNENSAPNAFAGHPDALLSPYYKSLAKELGGADRSPGNKAIAIKDRLKRKYLRTRMGQMFNLTTTQFDSVLTDVGAEVHWRDVIQETGGGEFVKPECPSSARLALVNARDAGEAHGNITTVKENTVSHALGRAHIQCIVVPESIFQLVINFDIVNVKLRPTDITILSRAFVLWVWCKTGKFNLGAQICRHAAKQFEARHPLGIDPNSPMTQLDLCWYLILLRQSRVMDRPDSLVRSLPRRLAPPSSVRDLLRSRWFYWVRPAG